MAPPLQQKAVLRHQHRMNLAVPLAQQACAGLQPDGRVGGPGGWIARKHIQQSLCRSRQSAINYLLHMMGKRRRSSEKGSVGAVSPKYACHSACRSADAMAASWINR